MEFLIALIYYYLLMRLNIFIHPLYVYKNLMLIYVSISYSKGYKFAAYFCHNIVPFIVQTLIL